jgi:hypothetical protein
MNCVICNDVCDKYDGKVWITLKNENYYDTYSPMIHYCSYLCHQRNKHHLPKDHWKNVMNKEDFDDLRPIVNSSQVKSFEYITYNEYIRLTDKEKERYDSQKEINLVMDREKYMFYTDIYEEDKRTSMIEADESVSDDPIDDY